MTQNWTFNSRSAKLLQSVTQKPTPKAEWVKVGDDCVSILSGMKGTVVKVRKLQSHTTCTVRWSNGFTGRNVTITNLRRVEGK